MKPLAVSLDLLDLHHLKNVLEAEGIRCFVKNELLSRLAGEVPFTECAAELHVVDEADRWRAEALITALRTAQPLHRDPWTCADCGERLEAQFTSCWRCGRDRPR